MTTLSSKIVNMYKSKMARIAVDAVLAVADLERKDVNFDMIKVSVCIGVCVWGGKFDTDTHTCTCSYLLTCATVPPLCMYVCMFPGGGQAGGAAGGDGADPRHRGGQGDLAPADAQGDQGM